MIFKGLSPYIDVLQPVGNSLLVFLFVFFFLVIFKIQKIKEEIPHSVKSNKFDLL